MCHHVQYRLSWKPAFVCKQYQYNRRRHTRGRFPQRINPCTEEICGRYQSTGKSKSRDFGRGLPRRLDCRHFSESSRAAVRRTDQDQTGQQRSEWCREPSCRRSAYILSGRTPERSKTDCWQSDPGCNSAYRRTQGTWICSKKESDGRWRTAGQTGRLLEP